MQTTTPAATAQHDDDDVESIISILRGLASNASCGGADRVAVDVHEAEDGARLIVEDDGRGMTEAQLMRMFSNVGGQDPFSGAEEVVVATTHDGCTLVAEREGESDHEVYEVEGEEKEGTRVEVHGVDAPDNLTERLDREGLRERLAIDESDWIALVTIREVKE